MRLHLAFTLYRGLIPVGLVKEHEWCPMIAWLQANTLLEPPLTPSMAMGAEEHRDKLLREVAGVLGLSNPRFSLYLESRRHGVAGVVDIVDEDAELIVEAKATERLKPGRHELVQLAVYALLAVENRLRIREAVIASSSRILAKLPVDDILLEKAAKAVKKTWETIVKQEPPLVHQPRDKCRYCRYRNICPYPST